MVKLDRENATTFGDWAYLAIAKHAQKFQKYESGVLQDRDPENLHQMRVGMRRLRSAMTGFSLGLKMPKEANERSIGKVARILGELRDLDVLLAILENQYQPDLPPAEQQELNKVLSQLHEDRERAFQKVKSTIKGKFYASLQESLKAWQKEPTYRPIASAQIKSILPDLLLPQISKFFLHDGWLVGVDLEGEEYKLRDNLTAEDVELILDSQGKRLHELRKEAKRTRYQMELFTQFYGENYQNYLDDVKEIQTVLGDIQDSAVLVAVLRKILGKDFQQKMLVFTKLIRDSRYQKWQQWRQLQEKFLADGTRQSFRNVIQETNYLAAPQKSCVP